MNFIRVHVSPFILPGTLGVTGAQANDNGGKDNISVILARTLKPFTAKKSWYSKVFDWF